MCLYTVSGSTLHVFMSKAGDRLVCCWALPSDAGLFAGGLDGSPLNGIAGFGALTTGALGTFDGSIPVVLDNREKFIY